MKKSEKALYSLGLLICLFLLLPDSSVSIQEGKKKLTYEQVYDFAKPRLFKSVPYIRAWFDDEHYLLTETDKKTKERILYKVNAKSGKKTALLNYSHIQKKLPKGLLASQHKDVSSDYSGFIYMFKSDLYHYSVKGGTLKQLTATPGEEKNPNLSPNGKFVAYTRDHDLYALDIDSGLEYRLTTDGSDTIYNGWASWVYMEEILLRMSRYAAFWWSPDSQKITFLRFNDSPVPTFPIVSAKGAHGELEIQRYPKAGDPNPYVKLGIVNVTDGKTIWVDVEEKADHYIAWPIWLPDSSKLTFQWVNRGQDNIKIYLVDIQSGKKHEIYDEKQSSWINFFTDAELRRSIYFFMDKSGFLLRSSVDGWDHLYYYDLEGNLKKRLTSGEWSVTKISVVDGKKGRVFFYAKKDKTTETHLYSIKLDGTGMKRLTRESGDHRTLLSSGISPGGSYFIDRYSSINIPTRQDLFQGDGTFVRSLGDSRSPVMDEYVLGKKQLFTIPTEDGKDLPAYWILPPDLDESQKYPVLISIYGGPGSSTVTNTFPMLSQLYFAQEGIIYMSVDHRGSGHFGKKGISRMHRNLGKWEMHDLIEAVKWLRKKPFVDETKIGITGGSYGGYVTCMALTYGADYFTHGYARSSVTDWHLYDTFYTERYMDRPCENKEGYKFGSALTHTDKLKGILFLAHGDMDDNVHMQNTIQLIDKLIDSGKNFEFIPFPLQRHGFTDNKKWKYSSRHSVDFWFKHFLNR
jgi:dipeptidyl-peptidase-4